VRQENGIVERVCCPLRAISPTSLLAHALSRHTPRRLRAQDKANRMNVRSAIAAVEDALCAYKTVPSTGLAIFAGPCV